ncbi:hypothetical protein WISP_18921 [Willisornis vidua]|uniref:Uncharacterized protein n=1 Tax=Willisornis vidua TaxID=1566151 RepID=A0ABQ9DP44_9PASS|nr:hypothetical protein WISP_18921 [Willisornis vidua]
MLARAGADCCFSLRDLQESVFACKAHPGSLKNNEPVKEPLNVLPHQGSPSPANSDKTTLDELWMQSYSPLVCVSVVVPDGTVEDQAGNTRALSSKGACIVLHRLVLVTDTNCVGVMPSAFSGTFPYGEDSSKAILPKYQDEFK